MSSVDFYRRVPKDLTEVRHEFTNERGQLGTAGTKGLGMKGKRRRGEDPTNPT